MKKNHYSFVIGVLILVLVCLQVTYYINLHVHVATDGKIITHSHFYKEGNTTGNKTKGDKNSKEDFKTIIYFHSLFPVILKNNSVSFVQSKKITFYCQPQQFRRILNKINIYLVRAPPPFLFYNQSFTKTEYLTKKTGMIKCKNSSLAV